MKQTLLLIAAFLFLQLNAQNLRSKLIHNNGTTKHYTVLAANEYMPFRFALADRIVGADEGSQLVLKETLQDENGTYFRCYQLYKHLPVENTMLVLHTRNELLTAVTGDAVLDFSPIAKATNIASVVPAAAIETAMKTVRASRYAWQNKALENRLKQRKHNNTASYLPTASLVWYNTAETLEPSALRLAWKVNIYAVKPFSYAWHFIDAQTGTYLGKKDIAASSEATGTANTAWSGVQTIHTSFNGTKYTLRDSTKGNGIITLHGENAQLGNDYFSNTANWSFPVNNINQAALDVHYGVAQSWQFYKNNFNRNSYDNAGGTLTSYVNDETYNDNAFWDGAALYFCKRSNGDPGGTTGIDVCGHEMTHGVTQETSGLEYAGESGGINESLSDIMGKSVQFWTNPSVPKNWYISNAMNWLIRNMANPNEFQHPDTYKGTYWKDKNPEVHTISGVGNYMFYLLTSGGSGTNDRGFNFSVNGIGLTKADKIIYRSNLLYLFPKAKYLDWRKACVLAATDLYGSSSNELQQVINAWDAIGVDSLSSIPCVNPISTAADSVTSTAATLHWHDFDTALAYNIRWKLAGANDFNYVNNVPGYSYRITGLIPNQQYQFAVQSVCYQNVTSLYNAPTYLTTLTKGNYCSVRGSTYFLYLQSVRAGALLNNSGDNDGYGDFISTVTPVSRSQSYTVRVKRFSTDNYSKLYSVYIDYNKNQSLPSPTPVKRLLPFTPAAAVKYR